MGKSVLIVDDEPGITAALMTRILHAGYEVFHAINGLAGVEAAAIHRPDIIILDIRMPDIDGYDACSRIKRIPGLEETPTVFLSANVQDMARQRAYEVGGSGFLSKPYKASEVLASIEVHVGVPDSENKEGVNHAA